MQSEVYQECFELLGFKRINFKFERCAGTVVHIKYPRASGVLNYLVSVTVEFGL